MNILITNDDSIHAVGLHALYTGMVRAFGEHHVFVVAPQHEQSACSHAITLHKALRAQEVGKNRYWVSGTPTDCVSLGLTQLVTEKIDLVLSGINHGPNLGTDVLNSGTVSGAVQACVMGYPSMSISLAGSMRLGSSYKNEEMFLLAVRAVQEIVEMLRKNPLPRFTFINMNVPAALSTTLSATDKIPYQLSSMGIRDYEQRFDKRQDPRGRDYYWNASRDRGGIPNGNSDSETIAAGKVAITPIQLDFTNYKLLEQMQSWPI